MLLSKLQFKMYSYPNDLIERDSWSNFKTCLRRNKKLPTRCSLKHQKLYLTQSMNWLENCKYVINVSKNALLLNIGKEKCRLSFHICKLNKLTTKIILFSLGTFAGGWATQPNIRSRKLMAWWNCHFLISLSSHYMKLLGCYYVK